MVILIAFSTFTGFMFPASAEQSGKIESLSTAKIGSLADTPSSSPAGDINMDQAISLADAILLLQYLSGSVDFSPSQLKIADVNADGAINVGDVIIILHSL